ncbi:nuclear transport factor 2 family protein [Microbulbifer sp. JMSA004]|uniref:nuclear transport factor 2 family protein n=1 Tax=unclassified Microbulbifer TaxID=2619833 RepID=UPI0024AD7818|nr:nuclear transport factor 2 family protein [Microbulbifer sp. VAAF005]WHI48632.1 nuclear transport factor 2 family protein [Microbulbifer sp. VAAF005]
MLKKIFSLFFMGLPLLSSASQAEKHPVIAGPIANEELVQQITKADQRLFDALFNNCDLREAQNLVTDDFEMYHDKWGQTAKSGEEFVKAITNMCKQRENGNDIRARRELVIESSKVYPVNHYGAIQSGTHRFYGINDDNSEVLRESSQFTHLWKQVDDKWQLARVLSFDHKPAE